MSKSPEQLAKDAEALIDRWFVDHFHGLGAKLSVDLYNHVHEARAALQRDVAKLLGHDEAAAAPAPAPASAATEPTAPEVTHD